MFDVVRLLALLPKSKTRCQAGPIPFHVTHASMVADDNAEMVPVGSAAYWLKPDNESLPPHCVQLTNSPSALPAESLIVAPDPSKVYRWTRHRCVSGKPQPQVPASLLLGSFGHR